MRPSSSSSSPRPGLPIPCIANLFLLLLSLLARQCAAYVENDFSSYPAGSQPCLGEAARSSGCVSAPTAAQLNDCLCYNRGDFVYATARCLAAESPTDLRAVYSQMKENCRGTGDTISVAEAAFMAQAEDAIAATRTSTSSSVVSQTAAPTPLPQQPFTGDDDGKSGGDVLSLGEKIGIGIGAGFGVTAAALAAWFIWVYAHRQQRQPLKSEESGDIATDDHPAEKPSPSPPPSQSPLSPPPLPPPPPPPPPVKYARSKAQRSAAELSPTGWKSEVGGGGGGGGSPIAAAAAAVAAEYHEKQRQRQKRQASKSRSSRSRSRSRPRPGSLRAELPPAASKIAPAGSEVLSTRSRIRPAGSDMRSPGSKTRSAGSEIQPPTILSLSGSALGQGTPAAVSTLASVGENYNGGNYYDGNHEGDDYDGGYHDSGYGGGGNGDGGGGGGGGDGGNENRGEGHVRQSLATDSQVSSTNWEDFTSVSSITHQAWPSHDGTTTMDSALGPAPGSRRGPPSVSTVVRQVPGHWRGSQLST